MKQNYHHGNLKEELIRVAFSFIEREGDEKLTLKVLAEATGTSRTAIYKHFANKDALLETIITEGIDLFEKEVTDTFLDQSKTLLDRFYIVGHAYVTFAKRRPNLYRLIFGKKYAYIREELFSIKDGTCHSFASLRCAVEEAQQKGIFKKGDPQLQSIAIWSMLHGLASIIIDGFEDVEERYAEAFETVFETLLLGMASNKVKLISTIPFVNTLLQKAKEKR